MIYFVGMFLNKLLKYRKDIVFKVLVYFKNFVEIFGLYFNSFDIKFN